MGNVAESHFRKITLSNLFRALLLLAASAMTGCAPLTSVSPPDHCCRTVLFPRIPLAEGERIESVEVVLTCGRFSAINRIPNDWSVEAIGPSSEVSTLKASSNHGSSALWRSADLDKFITIMDCSDDCFDIRAKIGVFLSDQERTVSFSRPEISLKPLR